jgi:hypothetical protein
MSDPSERVLDCSEQPQVGLMKVDLKFRFVIRIRLVDGIALLVPVRPESDSQLRRWRLTFRPVFRVALAYIGPNFLSISDFLVLDREIPDKREISYTHEKAMSAPRMKTALYGQRYGSRNARLRLPSQAGIARIALCSLRCRPHGSLAEMSTHFIACRMHSSCDRNPRHRPWRTSQTGNASKAMGHRDQSPPCLRGT